MRVKGTRRAIFSAALLLLGSVLILPAPASAAGWTKTDMGLAYSGTITYGLTGIAVGNGDGAEGTDIFVVAGDNAHVYMYRYENSKWSISDIITLVRGNYIYTFGILVGDGDDDGKDEVYAAATDYSASPYAGHIYQVSNGSKGWTKADCGATGYWCYDIAIGDGDRDDSKELYTADYDGHIYEYSKGQTWNTQDIGSSPGFVYGGWTYATQMNGVAVGDGDNDNKTEVYGASSDNHIYKFTWSGSAWSRSDLGTGETPAYWYYGMQKLVIGDGDNDGKNEVYGASYLNGTIWRYKWNSESKEWAIKKMVSLGTGVTAKDIVIGDGNSDGDNELYVATSNKQIYEVRLNSGAWEYSSVGSGGGEMNGVGTGYITNDTSVLEVFAASADGHAYEFYNDAVPPYNPKVWSDTHPDNSQWYGESKVHVLWKDQGYDRSGIDGYSVAWDKVSNTLPDTTKDFEQSVHEDTKTLEDGQWYFHIRAKDTAGNWNASAANFGPIKIDTQAPDYCAITINSGAEYTNDRVVSLAITATDAGSGVAQMAFSNDGSSWSEWEAFSAARSGWDLTDARYGGTGSDGQKTVFAKTRDFVKNELPADKRGKDSIFLDRVAPAGLAIVIDGGAKYATAASVQIALKAYDPDPASGVERMAFSNDGATWSEWMDWSAAASWSLTGGAGGVDQDGTKTVYYRVRDRAQNVGGPEKDSIFLDRRAPGEIRLLINNGEEYTNSATVTLAVDGADPDPGSGVSEMTVANSESALGAYEPFSKIVTAWSLTAGAGGTDSDGDKAVHVKLRDRAGNVGGPVKDGIFLDRQKPVAIGILINDGGKYTISPDVRLFLKASDADPSSGLYMMQFSDDGATWTAWEPFANMKRYTLPSPDGLKTVHFRVSDRAGNVADEATASVILDTAGPVISNVRVVGITDKSAIITWSTDEEADSSVDFGLTTAYGSSKLDPGFVSAHSVPLSGLTPTTTYHFRVQSTDRAGNPPAFSPDYVFITTATPDTTPPTISNVQVVGVTDTLAVVTWTTNEPADSAVEYGKDTSMGQKIADPKNFVLKHSMTLTGLEPSTTYRLKAASTDPSGNGPARSEELVFTTMRSPDTTAPIISNIKVSGITDRLAVVTWETDEPADGAVEYGLLASYGSKATHAGLGTLHEVTLLNLKPSTAYHFRVRSTDASGNGPGLSEDSVFTTAAAPDNLPPAVLNLHVSGISQTGATVLWETDEIADAHLEYGTTTAYGLSSSVNEFSLSHSLLLANLKPDTLYHLRVRSADPSGNLGQSGDITFRTLRTPTGQDVTAPFISAVQATGVSNTRAVIIWATDELANSEVEYGTSSAYGLRASDPAYTFTHSIVLDGLKPSTEYRLRVRSYDVFGNGPSVSEEIKFSTAAQPDRLAPVISGVQFSNLTNTSVLISWTTDEPADSAVDYGTTVYYDRNQTSRLFVLRHEVLIAGLLPGTTYHFSVRSADPAGNPAQPSQDQSFTTLKKYTPPGTKPTNGGKSEFPYAWAAIMIIAAALAAGLYIGRRATVGRLPPKALDDMKPEPYAASPGAEVESTALASLDAPQADAEAVETLSMDEPPAPEGAGGYSKQAPLYDRSAEAAIRPSTYSPAYAPARAPHSSRTDIAASSVSAGQVAQFAAAPRPAPELLRHIRCPSCRTRIPIYKEGPQQVTCPGCGRQGPYKPKATGTQYAAEAAAAPEPPAPQVQAEPEPAPAQQAPLRMTRCSGCGSQVPIHSDQYPVRITCPGCGRTGMYKGPRKY
jgi:ribosomal protein S27E